MFTPPRYNCNIVESGIKHHKPKLIYVIFVTDVAECDGDEWQCVSKQCIPIASRCDVKQDCYDGSDELNCGKINRYHVIIMLLHL